MTRLAYSAFLLLAVLCLSVLPFISGAVSQPLLEVQLAQQRAALLAGSTSPLSSASLQAAVAQMDCPITSNWVTNFSDYQSGIWGLAPVSGCTLLAVVSRRTTWDGHLVAIDVRNGSTLWTLPVSDGLSIFSGRALAVSPSLELVFMSFRNFTKGGGCEFSCSSFSAVSLRGGKAELLWNAVMDDSTYEMVAMGQADSEVLVAFGPQWINFNGRTGAVLSRTSPPQGGVSVLGDNRDGRVLINAGSSATAYQLQADGSWKAAGQTQWTDQEQLLVLSSQLQRYFAIPRLSSHLLLQSTSQPDQLRGVDAQTGQTVWSASGYDILTGQWVSKQVGYQARPALMALHPINSSWVLITGRALNLSDSTTLLMQHALLDLSTGRIAVTSPLSAALPVSGSYSANVDWYAASNRVATYVNLPGTVTPSLYLAYDSTSLQVVSSGALPSVNPLTELATSFTSLGKEAASLVWRTDQGQVVGQRCPAMAAADAQVEKDDNRHVRVW